MKPVRLAGAAAVALSLLCAPVPAAVDASSPATAAESSVDLPPEYAALREQAITLHDRAVEGEKGSAEQAMARLERYLERFADDVEARAYFGSAYALMARDASSVVNKTRYANRGLRHLDRALDAGAGNFTVRMIRANVNSSLPEMFGRGDAALDDMLALDRLYQLAPSPRMAREMVRIYEELQHRAPDAGPWTERLDRARELSGEP
ncbi:MAG: hypothetical protein OXC25_02565 [Thiotrichales bacterium]|nr:hypothetical protein [Thiotrichales bacterium]MCY4286541.1 hypothetical protein [Thiotrichales bacterium]MCY4348719.1 hypothetical protein [Thiotrichales bacterium]